jgi:hypothetical protein
MRAASRTVCRISRTSSKQHVNKRYGYPANVTALFPSQHPI